MEDQESVRVHPELKREIHEVSEKVTDLRIEVGEIKTQNMNQSITLSEVKDAIREITKLLGLAQETKKDFDRHVAEAIVKEQKVYLMLEEQAKKITTLDDTLSPIALSFNDGKKDRKTLWAIIISALVGTIFGILGAWISSLLGLK